MTSSQLPQTQAILDTALAKASSDARTRFTATVSDSVASETNAGSNPRERSREADAPTLSSSSAPILQRNILLPVVVDGRQILLPLDAAAVAGRGLALAVNLAPTLGNPSRLEAKPVNVECAYELYLRGQGLLATNEEQHVEAATTLLDHALDIDPCFARAQAARGYACAGHAEQAHAKVVRLTEAEPHNGYLKYRLTHVLAELGDAEKAIRILGEAVQDGFLSVQLLRHDERLGLSSLVDLAEYHKVRRTLQQNVEGAMKKYAPSP